MALNLIGAGLGRTGTLSTKLALEELGLGPCYHMTEFFMNPALAPLWIRAADGQPEWDAIFAGYASTVDYPGCLFWRELAQFYPGAKVLLTVRDPAEWFESTQASIFSDASIASGETSPFKEFFDKTVWGAFRAHIHDRDFMIDLFKRHNAEVEHAIPRERLFVYQVTQGWAPLCHFVGAAVPDRPFPRSNTREAHARRRADMPGGGHAPMDIEVLGDRVRKRLAELRERKG